MGSGTWNSASYAVTSKVMSTKTREEIFTGTRCHEDLDPSKFAVRESCDSDVNPASTPIIIAVDETGSMGFLAEEIIKKSLGVIVEEIHKRKPITDPHIMLVAVGDCYCDRAPIQATQFEADTCITDQIEKFYIEGNGGGNNGESYSLAWALAAHKTKCDAFIKRGKKGFLFTIGDERVLPAITAAQAKQFLGLNIQGDLKTEDLLEEVQRDWEVFHLLIPTHATRVQQSDKQWKELLCERAIIVEDHKKLGEIIVSTMQLIAGEDIDAIAASWDGSTSVAVRSSLKDLSGTTAVAKGGVVNL